MTLQQLRDFLTMFCMEHSDIADKMHISIDSSVGCVHAQYEDDDGFVVVNVSYDTFRVENIMKQKNT